MIPYALGIIYILFFIIIASDPSIFIVKCRTGEEKATLLLLMRKFFSLINTANPLRIQTAYVPEGAKGYILIEAFKITAVKEAIAGINNLRVGLWRQEMVPIIDMPDLFKQRKRPILLRPKQLVRIRRGKYKQNLAQVESVHVAQSEVTLKFLPRIESHARGGGGALQRKKLKQKCWDQPKLLNPEDIWYYIAYFFCSEFT